MPRPRAEPDAPAFDPAVPRPRLALAATLLSVTIAALDTTLANTALPTIAHSLAVSPQQAVWVVNAYQLAMVATLLPFAALGDWLGPRRVCLGGLVAFVVASVGCMLAHSLWALVLARTLQGVAAGALMSVNLALVRMVFRPERLGRGVGLNAGVVGVGVTLGPGLTAGVLAVADWPWLFALSLPLALAALACGWAGLPARRRGHPVDGLTALLTATTFAALIGLVGHAAQRSAPALLLALGATVVLAGGLLLRRQRGHPAPMLPVDLLSRPQFALSVLTSVSAFSAQGLAFVGLPFHFQTVLGHDAVATGLLMLPWAAVVAAAAPVAGPLSDRIAPGLLGGLGLALLALGFVLLARLTPQAGPMDIAWRMALCGAGFGLFQAPNLRAIMASAPPERATGASGMIAMARLTGQALGAAGVALCFGLAGARGPVWALAAGAGCAATAALASAARLRVR